MFLLDIDGSVQSQLLYSILVRIFLQYSTRGIYGKQVMMHSPTERLTADNPGTMKGIETSIHTAVYNFVASSDCRDIKCTRGTQEHIQHWYGV